MTPHTLPPLTLTLGGQHLLMPIWPSDTWRPGQDDPPLTSNLIFCLQSVLHMGTQVFILSCATLIMALILFPELREKFPFPYSMPIFYTLYIKSPWVLIFKILLLQHHMVQKVSFSFLSHPTGFLNPRANFLFLWPL